MFCRYILAPLAALLLVPALVSPAAAQRPGDWDRVVPHDPGLPRDNGQRDWGRGGPRDSGQGGWVLLGTTRVGGIGVDRDVVDVGRREGRFSAISIEAMERPIFVLGVTVVFGNDEVQQIDLRQRLNPGEHTTPIYLQGRGLPIKRFEVAARAGHDFHRRGILNIYAQAAQERGYGYGYGRGAPDRRDDYDRGRPDDRRDDWRGGRAEWELLGQNNIGFGTDHEVIRVGRDGRFAQIVLEVARNEVNFQGLTVFYLDGPPQQIDLRQGIGPGEHSQPIDIAGGRGIDRIEFAYKRHKRDPGRADVMVYGLRVGGGRSPPPDVRGRWEELGCQNVGFGADRDVVRVGRQEGRFSAIRLRVDRADVFLISLRVVYEHGQPDDYQVNTRMRAGTETQPLDLRGERRSIRQVELVYSSIPSFRGTATVCVDGR